MICWAKYFPVFVLVNRFGLVVLMYPGHTPLNLSSPRSSPRLYLMLHIRRIVSRETFRVRHAG